MDLVLGLGTRPELIKMAPVIRELKRRKVEFDFLTTGQHYSDNMFSSFLDELGLPDPDVDLKVGSGGQGLQAGKMMIEFEKYCMKTKPKLVVVNGDTNSTMALALTAAKNLIKTTHVEAGLRNHDKTLREEINRIVVDHVSDALYAHSERAVSNLKNEGLEKNVILTGNTVVDVVLQSLPRAKESKIAEELGLPGDFVLLTMHRAENVDSRERFSSIVSALEKIEADIVYPIHPRSIKMAKEFGLYEKLEKTCKLVEPLGYMDFLKLILDCRLVLTDSGGIQEEAICLSKPCVTMRDNTERQETVECGANVLVGANAKLIESNVKSILGDEERYNEMKNKDNPYGDGKASVRIADHLESLIQSA